MDDGMNFRVAAERLAAFGTGILKQIASLGLLLGLGAPEHQSNALPLLLFLGV